MAEQAGRGDGQGATPGRGPGLPGGDGVGSGSGAPGRDARLSGFGRGGEWDTCLPSGSLAVALEAACGPGGRCPGASRDEMFGLLRQWQAMESRAAAGKLAVLRALIREDDEPLPGGGYHGDLPEGWTRSLTHEVAAALAMPAVSADQLMWAAWNLEGRLPEVGALLAGRGADLRQGQGGGRCAAAVVRRGCSGGGDDDPARPARQDLRSGDETRRPGRDHRRPGIGDPPARGRGGEQVPGATGPGRVRRGRAVRPRHAHRPDPGRSLDVCARAQEYKESGAFGDDVRMDQYRVSAYLDLLNGITCDVRIASGVLPGTCPADEPPSRRAAHEAASMSRRRRALSRRG